MTRIAASKNHAATAHSRRRRALGALALGLGLASAAPALAECTGLHLSLVRPRAAYSCHHNCRVTEGEARLWRSYTFAVHDARPCMDTCTIMRECTAISIEFTYETRDGRTVPIMICNIWRGGDVTTVDDGYGIPGRIRGPLVCYPDRSLRYDERLQIDTRAVDQDSFRPAGLPRIGLPHGPSK